MNLQTALSLHQSGRRAEAAAAYETVLAREPQNAQALHGFGVLRHQSGDSASGAALIEQAIALHAAAPEFHFNLGLAKFRLGDFSAAAASFAQATRLKPDWPQPHYDLGNALAADGQTEAAVRAYRAALKLRPDYNQAEVNMANVLKGAGKRQQAIAAYRRVLRRAPDLPEVHNNLGAALLDEGDRAGAEAAFRAAISLRPAFAEGLGNLADLLIKDERFGEAVPVAAAACAAAPERPGFCEMHGDALRGAKQFDAAIAAYQAALVRNPAHNSARFGIADTLRLKRDLAGSEAMFRALADEFAGLWQAHHDLANVLRHQGRFAESAAAYRRAVELHENAETLSPLGMVLRDLQALGAAESTLRRALALKPEDEDVRYNLATTLLTDGQWREGFSLYDSRFKRFKATKLPGRAWTHERLRGRTLLVAAEQGLGDTLQFIRYVPALAASGARVVLRVHEPLVRLLAGFPGAATIVGNRDDALPSYDLHVSVMSLPHRLGTVDPMPIAIPYLQADTGLVAAWRARLAALPGRRVGIVWAGNSAFGADHFRSVAPEALSILADVPAISFVSLQKGTTAKPDLPLVDWADELGDMADTAALIAALDLVISVDTSVAHLAGALGQKVWLLNRFDTCWRWGTERSDSVWYPSMRIFRQPAPLDWPSVLRAVHAELLMDGGLGPLAPAGPGQSPGLP